MIQEFQIQNFFSIRERQTLSFLPTNDDKMRSQYLYEVAEGVELLKIGIVYGSNASGKTTLLDALSFFRRTMLDKPENKNMGMGYVPFLLDNHSRKKHFLLQMLKASDFIYHSLEVFIQIRRIRPSCMESIKTLYRKLNNIDKNEF